VVGFGEGGIREGEFRKGGFEGIFLCFSITVKKI
jgi:hypothetical protein